MRAVKSSIILIFYPILRMVLAVDLKSKQLNVQDSADVQDSAEVQGSADVQNTWVYKTQQI